MGAEKRVSKCDKPLSGQEAPKDGMSLNQDSVDTNSNSFSDDDSKEEEKGSKTEETDYVFNRGHMRKERYLENVIINRNVLAINVTKTYNKQKHNILLVGIYVNGNDVTGQKDQYAQMINMFINSHFMMIMNYFHVKADN